MTESESTAPRQDSAAAAAAEALKDSTSVNDDDNDIAIDIDIDDDDDDPSNNNTSAGAAEAGVVRGVSRSVAQRAVAARSAGRAVAKLPSVGQLPRRAAAVPKRVPVVPKRVPVVPKRLSVPKTKTPLSSSSSRSMMRKPTVRKVAKYSDRMSTGLEVWELAAESSTSTVEERQNTTRQTRQPVTTILQQQLPRVKAFAISLIKNSILGAIVFETYCEIVARSEDYSLHQLPLPPIIINSRLWRVGRKSQNDLPEQQQQQQHVPIYKPDAFERTPLAVHFVAGAAAGSLQGLGTFVWDTTAALSLTALRTLTLTLPTATATATVFRPHLVSMGQHAVAHSMLFGSYESLKRLFLWRTSGHFDDGFVVDDDDNNNSATSPSNNSTSAAPAAATTVMLPQQRLEYFLGVSMAGGLAGQFQHICSHVLEQQQQQQQSSLSFHSRKLLRQQRWSSLFMTSHLPTLRSTLWAFPPSAIAFLAFEYGKETVAELATATEEEEK